MIASKPKRIPKLRHHKASGQGFVQLDGRFVYLGRYDEPETAEAYHRLIAEWLAGKQVAVAPGEGQTGSKERKHDGESTRMFHA